MSVAFSPDDKTLAVASDDEIVTLWDVNAGKEKALLTGHRGGVNSVVFSPDGKTLASGGGNFKGEVILWDVGRRELKAAFTANSKHGINSVAFSPNGKLLATGSDDHTVKLWDVSQVLGHSVEKWAISKTELPT